VSPSHLIGCQFRTAFLAFIFTLLPGKLISLAFPTDTWITLIASVTGTAVVSATGLWISLSSDVRAEIRSRLFQRF
jgi:hypothetical protein